MTNVADDWDFGLTPKMTMSVNLEKLNETLAEVRPDIVVTEEDLKVAGMTKMDTNWWDAEPVYLSLEGRD